MMSAQLQQQQRKEEAATTNSPITRPAATETGTATTTDTAATATATASEDTTSTTSQPTGEPLRSRVSESHSPFVRSQAETLVQWQLFDQEAVDLAKKQNKLIFLHIGYYACHYSFSNPEIASLINSSFIPIVVDREQRPDIDAVFWNYLQIINSSAGWPINVFLTPELEPVYGGAYWPGPNAYTEDSGVGLLDVLEKLQKSWAGQELRCREDAQDAVASLRQFASEGMMDERTVETAVSSADSASSVDNITPEPVDKTLELDLDQLEEAYQDLRQKFDRLTGSFSVGPKFLTAPKYSFALQLGSLPQVAQDVVGEAAVANATDMARQTLRRLRDSALRDHVGVGSDSGAGFARGSQTLIDWNLPHFEKLVPENALLLRLYLEAWLGQPDECSDLLEVVYSLADYLSQAPIRLDNGGFAASEAADAYYRKGDQQKREGAYYLWTRREFDAAVGGGSTDSAATLLTRAAAAYWNVQQHGNVDQRDDPADDFINQNVLYVAKTEADVAKQFGIASSAEVHAMVQTARQHLARQRLQERVPPAVDHQVVVSGNSIVLGALARTAAALKQSSHVLDKTKADRYLAVAVEAAEFLKKELWDPLHKTLYRSYSDGHRSTVQGFAEDYTFLIEALLDLYEATANVAWLEWADELQETQISLFYDFRDIPRTATHSSTGGFYRTTENGHPFVPLRIKDGMDTTLPATNGVAAANLFRLSHLLADARYDVLARETIHAFEPEMLQHASLFPTLLLNVVAARLGGPQLAVLGGGDSGSTDEVTTQYFVRPKAGLRSLLYVPVKERKNAWLLKRNPTLELLVDKEPGTYAWKKSRWEKATLDDLAVQEE